MDELHRLADKLEADTKHIKAALERGDADLAMAAMKRARRHCTMLLRHTAEHRDTLQH